VEKYGIKSYTFSEVGDNVWKAKDEVCVAKNGSKFGLRHFV
jgi:hypothetical protein